MFVGESKLFQGVIRGFHMCSKGLKGYMSSIFHGCFIGVTRVFFWVSQRCHKGVARVLHFCFKGNSRVFQLCFEDVSWMFQGHLNCSFRVFQGCFIVFGVYQRCFKIILGWFQRCF